MKLTLEGYHDTGAGWEFDSPLLVVKPVVQMHDAGSVHEAERVVEDFVESLSMGSTVDELDDSVCYDRRVILRDFRKAKKGSKRFLYWCQTVEIPDDIDWDADDAIERVTYGPLQIGTTAPTGAHDESK